MNSFSFLSQSAFVSAGLRVGETAVHTQHCTMFYSAVGLHNLDYIRFDCDYVAFHIPK